MKGKLRRLIEAKEGKRYEVVSIPEEEEDVERLLPFGILPGAEIKVSNRESSSAVLIRKNSQKIALSSKIASRILVKPSGKG